MNYQNTDFINSSIIKWPGGKKQEIKIIKNNLPQYFNSYYEPFVGGGSCYLNIEANKYFINDKCNDLIDIYKISQNTNFLNFLQQFDQFWMAIEKLCNTPELILNYKNKTIIDYVINQVNSISLLKQLCKIENVFFQNELKKRLNAKLKNLTKLNQDKDIQHKDILNNIEVSIKSAFYNYSRHLLNHYKSTVSTAQYSAIYFFVRDMAYSGMFRYCKNGNFNVPYGGIGYNSKTFKSKIQYLQSTFLKKKLENSKIFCKDFYDFLQISKPTNNDFIFLDPPYDSEFSTYSKNIFNRTDQERLANYLINETQAKWMLIIKSTDFVQRLYLKHNLQVIEFNKTYQVSFKNRNNRKCVHLLIRNYE
jgi:DNA adenine methylase